MLDLDGFKAVNDCTAMARRQGFDRVLEADFGRSPRRFRAGQNRRRRVRDRHAEDRIFGRSNTFGETDCGSGPLSPFQIDNTLMDIGVGVGIAIARMTE
jgi:hypothetical protein